MKIPKDSLDPLLEIKKENIPEDYLDPLLEIKNENIPEDSLDPLLETKKENGFDHNYHLFSPALGSLQ